MSRDVKELIAQLEAERDELVSMHDELEQEVHAGEITKQLADEILWRACNGQSYRETLAHKNALIHEAQTIVRDQRKEVAVAITPGIVVVVLGLAFIWSFGGITGLFTYSDETFYNLGIDATATQDAIVPLPLTETISSLRVNGIAEGTGEARIWLKQGDSRVLVASFDSDAPEPSALTGFFTADTSDIPTDDIIDAGDAHVAVITEEPAGAAEATETPAIPSDIASSEDSEGVPVSTNDTIENNTTENITVEIPVDVPAPEHDSSENNTSELPITPDVQAPNSEETPEAEIPSDPTEPVVLPSTPPDELDEADDEENTVQLPSSVEFDKECLQSCILTAQQPSYELEIEIDGDVTLTIDSVVYGTKPVVPETPVENGTNETAPLNQSNESNETSTGLALGTACTQNEQCASGVCTNSMYHAFLMGGVCTATASYCVANNTVYDLGQVLQDSICIGGTSRADWLVQTGQGRFEIKNAANETVAVIDKFGSMAIAGTAQFGSAPLSEGWVLRNADNTTVLAIDNEGNLASVGQLTQRTTPVATAGEDFIIKDTAGVVRAVLSQDGHVQLTGDLIEEVTFS